MQPARMQPARAFGRSAAVKARRGAFLALAALAGVACGDNGNPVAPSDSMNPVRRINLVLAFGDSLTFRDNSYVRRLEWLLQTWPGRREAAHGSGVSVRNAGRNSELLQTAVDRFKSEIGRDPKPDVVIILEGTNDLLCCAGGSLRTSALAAAGALEWMLDLARAASVAPIVATVPPIRETGRRRDGESTAAAAAAVPLLNGRIRRIAQARGIPLVDVEEIVRSGDCPGTEPLPCLNESGYHLSDAAYGLIARAFFDAIRDLE